MPCASSGSAGRAVAEGRLKHGRTLRLLRDALRALHPLSNGGNEPLPGGYYTESCKVYRCCRERELAHCGECAEFPCARLGGMGDFRDLDTGHVKPRTCRFIAEHGFAAWQREYSERAALLTEALAKYNDGRMKRFLCELFIKTDLDALRELMRRAEAITGTPKEAGKSFRALAEALDIETLPSRSD